MLPHRVVQTAVGHEGQHCLMLCEDGTVFFTGAAKRGEDGEGSGATKASSRRAPKPVKPKKLTRMEGVGVVDVGARYAHQLSFSVYT